MFQLWKFYPGLYTLRKLALYAEYSPASWCLSNPWRVILLSLNIKFFSFCALLFGAAETIRQEHRAAMNPMEQAEYDLQKAELDRLEEDEASIREMWAAGGRMGLEGIMGEIIDDEAR